MIKNIENVTYGVIEETYSIGSNKRTAYGIAAYSAAEIDGTSTIVASVRDISSDRGALEALAERLTCLELSPTHLDEVVEDFLAD